MFILSVIIIALLAGWWISTTEIAVGFGSVAGSSMSRNYVWGFGLLIAGLSGGVFLARFLSVPIVEYAQFTTPVCAIVIALVGFATVLACYKFYKYASVIYGVFGAILGWQFFMYHSVDKSFITGIFASWLVAPVLTFALAASAYFLYRKFVIRYKIHYIKILAYLRPIVILSSVLLALAIGMNNGAIFEILNSTLRPNFTLSFYTFTIDIQSVLFVISFLIILLLTFKKALKNINDFSMRGFDVNVESAVFITLPAAVILLVFSFRIVEIVGLRAVPVSIAQIAFAALLGVNFIQKHYIINVPNIFKSVVFLFLTPAIAFAGTYLLFDFMDKKTLIAPLENTVIQHYDIAIPLLVSIVIIFFVILFIYFRKENLQKLQIQRKSLADKQSLFESEKAKASLEVKTVVLENESLSHKLELRRQELMNMALGISEQKEFLEKIYNQIKIIKSSNEPEDINLKINELEKDIARKMNFSQEIDSFYTQIESVHKDFNIRLMEKFPDLSEYEKRLITFLRLGFSSKHIASLMNIAPKSVEISRYRLRTKLKLNRENKLINFIKSI